MTVIWRLEEGYSRFVQGSRVELRLEKGPLRSSLNVFPRSLPDRSRPVEFTFRATHGFRASGPGTLRWRVRPQGLIRGLVLFSGNAFLGNFRVPRNHFAVQWDVEASVMGAVAVKGFSSLLEIDGRTRLRHSWVEIFPGEVSIGEALQKAWKTYRSPLEPDDIFQISDSQVVRWRWSGRLQLQVEVKWDVAKGWTFPGKIPPFQLQQTIVRGAGLDAQFRISQRGQFFIQVSKRKGRINFSLQRSRERQERKVFSAGLFAENPVRIKRLQWRQPEILDVVSEATSRPLLRQLNRVFEEALVKRMEIAFAIEHNRWKRSARLLHATWSRPRRDTFVETYAQLLQGQIPQPGPRLSFRGKFEQIRGTRLKVNLNLLDWIRVGKSTEKREEQRVLLSPSGEVVIEKGRVLEKTTYRWDEIQFLRVLYRKTADQSGQSLDFLWTFGQETIFPMTL